ncbi:hypothetical protein RJ55_02576 [Drechmeria coniospora]|nr:hypothetical protein RJ55_02576 [Drechmeria coniospora]
MSAAAGAPPPPPGRGSGPRYGHYTDKSDRRRALGEYLVEGDSSDEEFAPPEEVPHLFAARPQLRCALRDLRACAQRNVYILVEARPKVGTVPGACAVLSPEFLALGRVWARTLALAEMEPAPVRPAYTLAPVPGVASPPAATDDNDNPNRTLVLAANALTPTRAGGRAGTVPSMQLGVFAQGVARALTGIQSNVRSLARRQQAQEGVSAELVATLAEMRCDIYESRKSRADGSPSVAPVLRGRTATDSFETLPEEDTKEDKSKEDTETDESE